MRTPAADSARIASERPAQKLRVARGTTKLPSDPETNLATGVYFCWLKCKFPSEWSGWPVWDELGRITGFVAISWFFNSSPFRCIFYPNRVGQRQLIVWLSKN